MVLSQQCSDIIDAWFPNFPIFTCGCSSMSVLTSTWNMADCSIFLNSSPWHRIITSSCDGFGLYEWLVRLGRKLGTQAASIPCGMLRKCIFAHRPNAITSEICILAGVLPNVVTCLLLQTAMAILYERWSDYCIHWKWHTQLYLSGTGYACCLHFGIFIRINSSFLFTDYLCVVCRYPFLIQCKVSGHHRW